MKGFFKTFLAALLAVAVVALLPIVILVASVSSSMSSEPVVVEPNSVLHVDFGTNIYDSPRMPSFISGSGGSFEVVQNLTTLQLIKAFEAAKSDPNIAGVYISPEGVGAIEGTAQIEEYSALINDFKKESGKFVVAYSESYTQGLYWLASGADRIFLNPEGSFDWRGLASQNIFFKGLLDKLGVEVQIVRHGTYKSAVEPYITDRMSPANRLQTEKMVGSMWEAMLHDVAQGRNLSPHYLNQHASTLAVSSPEKAVELGFVDQLAYYDEVMAYLAEKSGVEGNEPNLVSLADYCSTIVEKKISPNKVAIIYADGEIIDGVGGEGIIGSATTADQIRRAREDKAVKAVVLRVNSPGGSALASEVMWRELQLLKAEKPIVVSMGNYAASGGYYISSPANHIIANRTTLTGSIGVFGMIPNGRDALKDKLGVTVDVAKSNPHADMGSLFRPLDKTELGFLQQSVEDVYGTFIGHVAEGRGMTTEGVDKIGQGRVWAGVDAEQIGLVDGFGGLKEALVVAAEKAELGDNYRITEVLEEEDELTRMINQLLSAKVSMQKSELGKALRYYNAIEQAVEQGGVLARMPYEITIY
ncbi:MAG: signal peptide peptidase SppA [Tidjanibacter sp.]|nr:signal peptide peptidase SppA [Tidjanibacter sp.]